MKSVINSINNKLLRGLLMAAVGLWIAHITPASAAPAEVFLKKDGFQIVFSWWTGGWNGTGPEYMWVAYVPTTVIKAQKDGSLWIHDCAHNATITIGTGEQYSEPSDVIYKGTGSITLEGLWTFDEETDWFMPGEERMNWHIMGTVFDTQTDGAWKLFWQYVKREGKLMETYRFEPVK